MVLGIWRIWGVRVEVGCFGFFMILRCRLGFHAFDVFGLCIGFAGRKLYSWSSAGLNLTALVTIGSGIK